jgi:hypothetical protein
MHSTTAEGGSADRKRCILRMGCYGCVSFSEEEDEGVNETGLTAEGDGRHGGTSLALVI